MILKTYMEILNHDGGYFRHSFRDLQGREIAAGTDNHTGLFLKLECGEKTYHFSRKIISIEKPSFPCRFPLRSNRKKALGYQVQLLDEVLLQSYREGYSLERKWIFSKGFPFTVYLYKGRVYHCYCVGFPHQDSHYYCVMTPEGETVAIIERHVSADDNSRSTVYFKDPGIEELAMLVCANETMIVSFPASDSGMIDPSSGPYISITEEEKSMYDKNFIPAVKAMDRIMD